MEVLRDGVDRAGAAASRDVLLERIGAEWRQCRVERGVGEQGDAVVLVRIGHPYRGWRGLEQAGATAQLGLVVTVELVVERQPRLDHAVGRAHRVVVAVAEGLGERGVVDRRCAGMRNIHAYAVLQRQLVADLPGVLQERAVLAVGPLACDVAQRIARRRVVQNVGVVVAGPEVADAPEVVLAELGLPEQVVDLVALVVEATLDGVVTGVIRAGQKHAELLRVDMVVVAVTFLAQIHRRALAGGGQVDVDGRLLKRCGGVLHELLQADLGLGGEVVGPVVEHVRDVVAGADRLGIGVAGQADAVGAVAGDGGQQLLGVLVGEAGAVVVADVPVDLAEITLVVVGQAGGAAESAGGQAQLLGGIDDRLQVARRYLVAGGRPLAQRAVQAVGRVCADAVGALVLGGDEEEQLVLDDRAADGEAAGPVVGIALVLVAGVAAGQPAGIANQLACIAIYVIHRTVELVGTRLGHGVDVGADSVGGDIEVGGGDVVLGDGVRRNRGLLVGQAVGVEAERITLADAIDADVVVAVVHAVGGDRPHALVQYGDARVEPGDVVDRAVALRRRLQLALRNGGGQALVVGGESLRKHRGADRHRAEILGLLSARGHAQVDRRRLPQLQIHVVLFADRHAGLAGADLERTAHTQAGGAVASIGIGDHRLGGARWLVHDGDGGAIHRLSLGIQHAAIDAGGGDVLGSQRRGAQQRGEGERQHPEANQRSHRKSLRCRAVTRTSRCPTGRQKPDLSELAELPPVKIHAARRCVCLPPDWCKILVAFCDTRAASGKKYARKALSLAVSCWADSPESAASQGQCQG